MLNQDKNERNSATNEYNIEINIHGTVNGNVAGINNGIMANSTSACSNGTTKYVIRPNIKDSNKESHKFIKDALDAQKDGNINVVISLIQKSIDIELEEITPDLNTIAFSKYLLVHYLLTDSRNDREVISIIDDILQTKDIEKDISFYCDVLLAKAHALSLNGEVKQARAAINIVDKKLDDEHKEESTYLHIVGQISLLEGNTDDAIYLLSKGRDNALSKYVIATSEEDKFANYQHYFAFLTSLGETYRLIHRPDLARNLWKNAVNVADEIGWLQEKVRPLFGLIECLIQYEEYDSAYIQLSNIYDIVLDSDNLDLLKRYYQLKATIQLRCNDNQWREAIDCLKNILQLSEDSNERVRILREIADIQSSHGDTSVALENLSQAKKINEINGIPKNNDLIEMQCEDIKQRTFFVDGKVRRTLSASSQNELHLIESEYNRCENEIQRLKLSLDIGIGYIDIDSDKALEWLSKTFENAQKMKDKFIASQALIGQVGILFGKRSQECEEIAERHIDSAIEMIKNLPIWEVLARAKMFKGMVVAHKENFKDAYQLFVEAQKIVESHKVEDQFLCDYISDCVDECKYILSKIKFTDIDFDTIVEEVNFMKCWYPKYKNELLHFLWYNRYEDIEKLLIASPKSKAFMITDKTCDILEWCNSLDVLFDVFSFSSETDYHTKENWTFSKFIPVPENMKSDFFNVFLVLNLT